MVTGQRIDRLYAWIATEEDGGEGVVAHALARNVAEASGRPVRLVMFSVHMP